jgi:hypothetical protein
MQWLVFFVVVPQLHATYELRLRYVTVDTWDCLVFVEGQLESSFSGTGNTSANELWSQVFAALGASHEAMPAGD